MEWLFPVLFALVGLGQWWLQRKQRHHKAESPSAPRHPAASRPQPDIEEEWGDLGDLLEALGRRPHDTPPPKKKPAQQPPSRPALELSPMPPKTSHPERPTPLLPNETFPQVPVLSRASAWQRSEGPSSSRWAERIRRVESIRDGVVLSEILAPPVALRSNPVHG